MTTDLAPAQNDQTYQAKHGNLKQSVSWNPTSKTTESTDQQNEQLQTALNDPNIKFPLENSWSFWFYKNERNKEWKDNVKFVTSVDFVEDFWGVYNHIQLVSKINIGCDYMFFKKDIPPMWDDPSNLDGGRWVVNLDKKYHHALDSYWLNTVIYLNQI